MESGTALTADRTTQVIRVPVADLNKTIVIRLESIGDTGQDLVIEHPVETQPAEPVESQHVGEIGERLTFKLKMIRQKILRSPTSIAYVYDFRDMNGNMYQWLTHRNKGMEEGNDYYLKCTIKKFYKRRGVNITAITRCRFV